MTNILIKRIVENIDKSNYKILLGNVIYFNNYEFEKAQGFIQHRNLKHGCFILV